MVDGVRRADARAARAGRRERARAVPPDVETRQRLLEAARRLFAADGFQRVSVRQICAEAGANVAAVNYHFGDKHGLYRQVLEEAIGIMRETSEMAMAAAAGGSAEARLRGFIAVFLKRVSGEGAPWIRQLMAQEMAQPTPGLDQVVREAIAPRIRYMATLVAELLGAEVDDERVMRCVLSVQLQFQAALANPAATRIAPEFKGDLQSTERLAQHVADFSLGGIQFLASQGARGVE